MRILAFFFTGGDVAQAAVAQLHSDLALDVPDAATADLVVDGTEGTVVALRVDTAAQDDVVAIVTAHGGSVVADVPEEWTRGLGFNSP